MLDRSVDATSRTPASGSADARYRLLAEHSRDIVLFVRREDGRILEANRAACTAYGYGAEELQALTIHDLRDPSVRASAEAQMAQADSGSILFETLHRRRDGTSFPVEVSSTGVSIDGARALVSVVRDVTERTLAQQKLRRSEAQLRTVVENLGEGVTVTDLQGNFLHWNRAGLAMHGFSSLEAAPHSYDELRAVVELTSLQGAELSIEERPLARILGGEILRDCELRFHNRQTGFTRVLSYGGSLARDGGGRPLMAVVTIRDVTTRRQADEALIAERERLAVTLRSIADAVIAADAQACITELNDMAAALTGWTAREATGRRLEEVFRIADQTTRAPARDPVARALREGSIVGLAHGTVLVARDGTERPIAASAAPIRDGRGRVQGVVLVFRDKTEERRTEEAVRRSEQRFRALIEKSTDVITVVDRELRVRFWSPSAIEALGWSAEEVLGRSVAELGIVHPDDFPQVARERQRLTVETSGSARVVARFRTRVGGWRLMEALARNLLDDPAVNGFVVNLRDITEQHRLEEQLRQAQKLESVGRLAGGIAHDFNNLLTVIMSCCEALQHDLGAGRPVAPEDLDEIQGEGARASELTRQLLAFARRQVIAPVPLDLNRVVSGSERLLRRLLGEDIDLVVHMQAHLWTAFCDPGQMEQVILNLAVNARDAMPRGGRLLIETSNLEVGSSDRAPDAAMPPGQYVRLRVQDTGVGMAPDTQERVFEPFFTTKEVGKGTGLGLATVYGIVKQSAGFVEVESQLGRGTTFEICFPRSQGAVAEAPGVPQARSRTGSESILLVEDNPAVREVASRALRGAGYSVCDAGSGAEALERVERSAGPLHLLVTDVVMPGMDGRTLAVALKEKHPGLRVLFMSGYAQDTIEHRGVPGPARGFLPKPFTPATLLARVRAVLDEGAGEAVSRRP
jgi:PAS domain S-box-containing protein